MGTSSSDTRISDPKHSASTDRSIRLTAAALSTRWATSCMPWAWCSLLEIRSRTVMPMSCTAGKDSTVKHVMGGLNPQGVQVTSFKQPTSEELHHDFLWRVNKALPPRGSIAIFNRSYYEDVLVVQVHDLQKTYQMAPRVLEDSKKDFFEKRYRQIRSYEEYLYENSYRVVKIFLHVSKDEQKKRFLERIDRPEKNWKFSCSDLKERMRFDEYLDTFDEVITATAAKHSPWYAIPADQKWYTRYLVSEIVLDALQKSCHEYPVLSDDAKAELLNCKAALEQE